MQQLEERNTYTPTDIPHVRSNCDPALKFAVELDLRKKDIVYHDVNELEDYPLVIER